MAVLASSVASILIQADLNSKINQLGMSDTFLDLEPVGRTQKKRIIEEV